MQSEETNEGDIFQSEKTNKEGVREIMVGLRHTGKTVISAKTIVRTD